jgi:septal ring factor EnvC (AmiA/AmiB activator)
MAAKVSADPFGKIKKMISDMVAKLMEEATDEAEHKGFCDTEMGTNKQTRDTKTTAAAELSAQIEQMTAEAISLAQECSELSQDIVEIDAAMAKATENRAAEKEKNTATIADAQAATAAVSQATTVLKEFYAKAAASTALTQMQTEGPADDAPDTFDKPFTGVGGEGGIVGMLEVILSDFERLESDTTTAEDSAEKEFASFSADSSKDKAVKNMDIKHKTDKQTKLEADVSEAKGDLKSVKEELDAAMAYFEKLKPSCMDAGESYEDRVARRKAEIESLKEALKILAGEA